MDVLLTPENLAALKDVGISVLLIVVLFYLIRNQSASDQRADDQQAQTLKIIAELINTFREMKDSFNEIKTAMRSIAETNGGYVSQLVLVEKGFNDHTKLVIDTLALFEGDVKTIQILAQTEFRRVTEQLDSLKVLVDKLPDAEVLKAEIDRVCAVIAETRQATPVTITGEIQAAILAEAEKPRLVNGAGDVVD